MLRPSCFTRYLCVSVFWAASVTFAQTAPVDDATLERTARHSTEEWLAVAPHLPDPASATAAQLQTAGDVLRARRYPEDAIEYFGYALKRGGDEVVLMNRMGVAELERGQPALARACFKRALTLKGKYSEAWNNLGAAESMNGNLRSAIADYLKAVKFDQKNALFHANLGTTYVALRDYESGRHQLDLAAKLDPAVFRRGGFGGSMVHVLAADDRGRFGFEMARLAAVNGQDETMFHWLGVAIEAGFDITHEMAGLKEFDRYRKDPRVAVLLHNAKALHSNKIALSEPVPSLSGSSIKAD